MDRSQFLNAPPYFDGSNYAFWKVRMRAFLCSIDEAMWDAVEIGWTKPEAAKSTWDKAALVASNANSKVLNAIFCGVSSDEFHWISHITIAKEAWQILETTYEGTKKAKDTPQKIALSDLLLAFDAARLALSQVDLAASSFVQPISIASQTASSIEHKNALILTFQNA